MPCYSPDYSESELCQMANDKGNLYGKQFEAVLCGIFTALDQDLNYYFNNVDWNEVGVNELLVESWWENHKKEDEDRRQQELKSKEIAERRKKLLEKLTDEEIALIKEEL